MKTLLRIAAGLSFLFCSAPGWWLISKMLSTPHEDGFILGTVGLFFIGIAFFLGGVLLFAAQKTVQKDQHR